VISVGNISVGGSGKTPLVAHLIEQLEMHWPVLVLSRGYGRRRTNPFLWHAGDPLPGALEIGDEPALLARRVQRGAIGASIDRAAYLRQIENDFSGSVVLLDDGFQHYALGRDLDIVIVDDRTAMNPAVIPVGDLREPPGGLARAGIILATSDASEEFARRWMSPAAELFRFRSEASMPVRWDDRSVEYDGRRVVAVSGIARPERFAASLRGLHVNVASSLRYPDHRRYGPIDLREISSAMKRAGADAIVTTAKDAVKLATFEELDGKIYVAHLDVVIEREEEFMKLVRSAIERRLQTQNQSTR
jgi:tetraacyldisaccharide 4'-kinase